MTEILLAVALDYATRGWLVFPAPASGAKKSYKSARHSNGVRWGATKDPNQIRHDWLKWPAANIGLPTGYGFWVMELDTIAGHGVDGLASLRQLQTDHSPLPETLQAKSPSDSIHYYFQWPANTIIRNSTSKIAPGIDVRGAGGMVLAPPSVRPGKGAYRWLNDCELAAAPEWLVALAAAAAPRERIAGAVRTAAPTLIATALATISADTDHGSWLQAGSALFHELGDETGFAVWNEWSAGSAKYPGLHRMRQHWECIVGADGYNTTIGTLFYLASKAKQKWREEYDNAMEARIAQANRNAKPRMPS